MASPWTRLKIHCNAFGIEIGSAASHFRPVTDSRIVQGPLAEWQTQGI